ncbi:unnamed protein product, partial [Didymodactylos carnosus]
MKDPVSYAVIRHLTQNKNAQQESSTATTVNLTQISTSVSAFKDIADENVSLSSVLFQTKPETEQQQTKRTKFGDAQSAMVTAATSVAGGVSNVFVSALTAVSGRITGASTTVTSTPKHIREQDEETILVSQPKSPSSPILITTRDNLIQRTSALIKSVKIASSTLSQVHRLEKLSTHLMTLPEAVIYISQERLIPYLLFIRRQEQRKLIPDKVYISVINECLSLCGYISPPKAKGIRVLTIDGGGVRGLVSIKALRQIEHLCGEPIYKLFDYMCGVSTG